jgi:type I restriction enzyme, S subunit
MCDMEGWISKKLEDIAFVNFGQSPDSKYYNEDGLGLPFLQGCADFGNKYPMTKVFSADIKKCSTENSILFSVRAPVGKLNYSNAEYCIGRGVASLDAIHIEKHLLFYFLFFKEKELNNLSQGSTFAAINSSQLKGLEIHFPSSLAEQQKIATILTTIDQSIAQTEQLIAKYKNIKQGLMHDLLNYGIDENGTIRNPETHAFVEKHGISVPQEWEVDKFDNLFKFYPTACYSRAEMGIEGDFFCVHYGDIHTKYDSFLYADKENFPTITETQSIRYMKLIDGDLVMADASEDYVGVGKSVEVLNVNEKQIIAGLHTLLIRSKNNKFINGYRGYIFHNSTVKHLLDDVVTGWKVYSISKGRLPEIYIPVPTTKEQIIIIKTLNSQNTLIESERTNLAKLKKLKQGLMADLLTGKIRVNI